MGDRHRRQDFRIQSAGVARDAVIALAILMCFPSQASEQTSLHQSMISPAGLDLWFLVGAECGREFDPVSVMLANCGANSAHITRFQALQQRTRPVAIDRGQHRPGLPTCGTQAPKHGQLVRCRIRINVLAGERVSRDDPTSRNKSRARREIPILLVRRVWPLRDKSPDPRRRERGKPKFGERSGLGVG